MNTTVRSRSSCQNNRDDLCPLDGRQTGRKATTAQEVMRPEEMRETEKVLNVMRDLTDGGASCMIVTH